MVALTESDAEKRLHERGLTLVQARKVSERFASFFNLFAGRVKQRDLIEFYQRLSESLQVGLPLLATLEENIKLSSSKRLARTIEKVKIDIENGLSLSQAMTQKSQVFDPLQVGLVAMGEQSGTLPDAMKHLADFLEWKYQQKSLIKRSAIYPIFILGVVLCVVGIWVGYVLPQLGSFFLNMQIDLPTTTKIVIGTSLWVQNNWFFIIGAAALLFLFMWAFRKSQYGRIQIDKYMLKVPLIGPVVQNSSLSRIGHYFSVMLEAGISLVTIFEMVTDGILGNKFIELQLKKVYEQIEAGKQFFEAFKMRKTFPDLFLGAIKTGEQAGTLADTFRRLGFYYDKEVKRSVKFMIAAFEPTVIVVLGSFFGIIILAILSPLYDIISKVGKVY